MSNILAEACVANLLRKGATSGAGVAVLDLSQLRPNPAGMDTYVEVKALSADLMFK